MEEKYNITGMSCASCQVHVEQAVRKLPGVKQVGVNLLSNAMMVDYDPTLLDANKIIAAVDHAGYGAALEAPKTQSKPSPKKSEKPLIPLIVSAVFTLVLLYISMGSMIGLPLPAWLNGPTNALSFAFIQLLLTLPVVYLNRHYFIRGFKLLFRLKPNMDSLIALGSSAALIYGVFAIFQIGRGLGLQDADLVHVYLHDLYFESAVVILTLVSLGKYLEHRAKASTQAAIEKLIDLAPKTALVRRDGRESEIAIEQVRLGDIVIIKAGMVAPVDGTIINGQGTFDQSTITGESIPVSRMVGADVLSATILTSGYVEITATKVGEDTTIATIIKLVETASNSKAPIAKLVDKIAGIFVPIVLAIALVATSSFLLLGYSVPFALGIGITVLVIACPCALGLATPVAIMVGTGKAAQNGLLMRSAEALEQAAHLKVVVLDKTGTVTAGQPQVIDIINLSDAPLLALAAGIEAKSAHPLALAITQAAENGKVTPLAFDDFIAIEGQGVSATRDGKRYFAGNLALATARGLATPELIKQVNDLAIGGKTPLLFLDEQQVLGIITVQDPLKPTSHQAVAELKKLGLHVVMLTGDHQLTAEAIAREAGIGEVIAEVYPADKMQHIANLQARNAGLVAMVGDGINDAPALAQADIGIAIGAGSDIARETADIILVRSDLRDVVTAIRLSKSVLRNIKVNLFWAFFYNMIGLILATGLFYPLWGLKLNPMIGAAAMSLSSIFVVVNALTLNLFRVNGQKGN